MRYIDRLRSLSDTPGLESKIKEDSYYVIKHGKGTFLEEVWEDQDTEDYGGNYSFTDSISKAMRIRKYDWGIELPKYLHYHTDGTPIDNLAHFLKLISGQLLQVNRKDIQITEFELKEVLIVEVQK